MYINQQDTQDCGYSHTTSTLIDIYKIPCMAYKVAPEVGLIHSETCTAFDEK